ncbi:MAG: peptide chain release factor N(5)-glutamine methyltransferase [Desulfobacteraceae bacterium]|nr:MAG: peptide chain release factor N(5)-glutamine methyltransferase [Desulfobacteraceae bacterium]
MHRKSWTIKRLLLVTSDFLKKKGIDSPRLTAEILLAHQLNIDRVTLYLNYDQPLNERELSGYRALIKRRLKREPLQYITGTQEFWSLEFMVNPHALIPRPETELLVEVAIERLKALPELGNNPPNIVDLGAGCGAIAISLAKEIGKIKIWATDISSDALKLARLNAEKHGVTDKITFLRGNLWEPLMDLGVTFDIVLSNPPYIAPGEFDNLSPEVRDYEPRLALDGREGGMHFIEKIIAEAPAFMNPGGWIMLEMSPGQTDKALKLIGKTKVYAEKSRIKDYSHLYRVVMAQKT